MYRVKLTISTAKKCTYHTENLPFFFIILCKKTLVNKKLARFDKIFDEDADATVTVNGGKITVKEKPTALYGDVNLDGAIDAKDLTLLARHVAKIEYITDPQALVNADINKDGGISSEDLTKLARHVAKIEYITE